MLSGNDGGCRLTMSVIMLSGNAGGSRLTIIKLSSRSFVHVLQNHPIKTLYYH
jgi:hypothetical protein